MTGPRPFQAALGIVGACALIGFLTAATGALPATVTKHFPLWLAAFAGLIGSAVVTVRLSRAFGLSNPRGTRNWTSLVMAVAFGAGLVLGALALSGVERGARLPALRGKPPCVDGCSPYPSLSHGPPSR